MEETFDKLRSEFVEEARSAPKLFRDLAKVEQYIAETYKARAFIELVQNADDAKAGSFGLCDFGNGFSACNDGAPFTPEDIEALCRSGSSSKRRGAGTIGFRGIGFKSVVNLAKTVYVFSGAHRFFFNKGATGSLLADTSDVPMIRIPHPVVGAQHEKAAAEGDRLMQLGFSTVFVFQEPNERLSTEEFLAFDRTCLLFLNNLRKVELSFGNTHRLISIETGRSQARAGWRELRKQRSWTYGKSFAPLRDAKNAVALKKVAETIVPAPSYESVFHSFTPTTEFAGAFLKINGDYSTDPSRKTIDADECSQRSFDDAVCTITDAIISLLNKEATKKGFFTPFLNVNSEARTKSKLRLMPALAKSLQSRTITSTEGKEIPIAALRLKPDWLGYEDYEKLCHGDIAAVPKDLVLLYPEIMAFLALMGVPTLLIQDTIEKVNESEISSFGRAQVAGKLLKQHRYDLSDERVQQIRDMRIFPTADGAATAGELKSASEVSPEFTRHLVETTDPADVRFFYKKLGLAIDDPSIQQPVALTSPSGTASYVPTGADRRPNAIFKTEPPIKRWRSAEQNAEAFIGALKGIMAVTDVSTANLGYDLEVLLQTGRKLYVEVKSVASFAESFRLTNNEYASAHSYGDDYFVAMVINGSPFELQMIRNPIESLEFQKQCERWSWYCEDYKSKLTDPSGLMSVG